MYTNSSFLKQTAPIKIVLRGGELFVNMQDELSANILGAAIEHERIDKGLTREALAERIQKSERYVAAIERGERTPSLKTCYKIVRCLGISADKLFYPEHITDDSSLQEISRLSATCTTKQREFIADFITLMKSHDKSQ